jgi:hypothetical protein
MKFKSLFFIFITIFISSCSSYKNEYEFYNEAYRSCELERKKMIDSTDLYIKKSKNKTKGLK